MTESFTDKMLAKAKQVLEVGSEAADVLVHLQHGLSPLGVTAVGMRVVNSVRQHRAKTPEEYFVNWKPLDLGMLSTQMFVAVRSSQDVDCQQVASVYESTPAVLTKLDGFEIGWGLRGDFKSSSVDVRDAWVQQQTDVAALLQSLGRRLWTYLSSSQVCLIPKGQEVKLIVEDDTGILPSTKGDELYERIKQFQAKGLRRSFFMIGEPGVGKSCLLRYIASLHGGFRLRLRMNKLSNFDPQNLIRVVEILRPDVLVIDDFDRYVMGRSHYDVEKESPEAQAMLDPLDVFDKLVPLVIVSANYSVAITEAVLRPGRFAEMVTIDELDPEIYAKMLPEASDAMIKQLKRLKVPVTYLEEIRLRAEALGYDVAMKEIPDLIERAGRILEKNTKVTKKKKRRKKTTPSLVGKTPAQKAVLLEGQGSTLDRKAAALTRYAASLRARAEKARERAEAERVKAKKASKKKKVIKKQ